MFNPQRKSKVVDILMNEKSFQLHLKQIQSIRQSSSPSQLRQQEQQLQEKYLRRIHKSKQEVKDRINTDILKANQKLMEKIVKTQRRPEENPEYEMPNKHFNSYYNIKRQSKRIKADNFNMVSRMIQQSSIVPSLQVMKSDFKQNKRYAKMVRKLPAIMKHEQQFRRDLSSQRLSQSKTSLTSKKGSSLKDRSMTQDVRKIESSLLQQ